MVTVGGIMYKYCFRAFVDAEKARALGMKLNDIRSPYTLWNSGLPDSAYFVLARDADRKLVTQLRNNPRLSELELFCNN